MTETTIKPTGVWAKMEALAFWATVILLSVSIGFLFAMDADASVETNCECLEQTPDSANTECICHVALANPHTICVNRHAVAAHLAHGDNMGACVVAPTTTTLPEVTTTTLLDDTPVTTTTLEEPTTTTTTTTTVPTTTCPDVPILKDPASLRWSNRSFFIHGHLEPPDDEPVDGLGVTLSTDPDGIFLGTGCPLVQVKESRWVCENDVVKVRVRKRGTGWYSFLVRGTPIWTDPSTKDITTRVSFICSGGENVATWKGELGKKISNKF